MSAFEELGVGDATDLLRRSERCESFNDDQLMTMASILVDEGFGEFERCSLIVRALRGEMDLCRSILSKIIICED